MDEFNFLFSLFGLLLGFAIAEVVGAFGRAVRAEEGVHVGWLTPLLGVSVLIDVASFWLSVWEMRDAIQANMATVLIGLVFCGGYYLIALQAVPPDSARWHDLDQWYWRVKVRVVCGLLGVNAAILVLEWLIARSVVMITPYLVANAVYLALLAAIVLARGHLLNLVLLSANVSLFGVSALYGALSR